ncbi:inositol polyphosphate multikinase [Drosophila sulfurigaster albostrigata]|uniref:inositol polyphosphate multikinase n=1 Tax=Drosophila sulfurigaster albostrigata TaxID=89887 RepID=UPI002D21903B|nr:inositol polyphosphate multikinase [Drosophila sulfurigaster albostrigata]
MAKKEQAESMVAVVAAVTPAVPLGYRQLGTQVAGHTFEASNAAAVGLLQDVGGSAEGRSEGRVFKPLGKPECGLREIQFYESLAAATSTIAAAAGDVGKAENAADNDLALLAALAEHVPRYYGQRKLVVNQREHTFLQLEDLTHGMAKPCVMDVKIGKRTWDPLSSPHKRAIEQQKYVMCKQNLGLCLPGFQVYQQEQPCGKPILIRHGRDYGKSLNVEGFHQALALFFNVQPAHANVPQLLREVLRQLRGIHSWFKRQRLLHFYASSLLICYDFDRLSNPSSQQNGYHHEPPVTPAIKLPDQWIRVRCIDFAHIFPAADAQPDENYMFGLQSLIDIVESMLQR